MREKNVRNIFFCWGRGMGGIILEGSYRSKSIKARLNEDMLSLPMRKQV